MDGWIEKQIERSAYRYIDGQIKQHIDISIERQIDIYISMDRLTFR